MRTRTLLILAVITGVVILAAGVAQLFRIATQDTSEDTVAIGTPVDVGDLSVVVESYDEADGTATVDLEIGGVDDEDGTSEFRLVVPGDSLRATGEGRGHCGATSVEEERCQLTFDVSDAAGGTRILLFRRGDELARWELSSP